jgi:hypothetical protein
MSTKKLVRRHGKIHIFVVRPSKIQHSALRVEAYHAMLSLELLLWALEIHVEAEPVVIRSIRKQDVEADGIGDDELIVDHGLGGVQQNLPISEF